MAVSEAWTEPSTLDLADGDIVEETQYDAILSDLLFLGRKVEPASLTNRSGGALNVGDVVVGDTGNASSITTTTTIGNRRVFGVVVDTTIASLAAGRISSLGIRTVNVTGAVAIGDWLETSATAGKAQTAYGRSVGKFAIALTSAAGPGAGTVTALLLRGPSYPDAVRKSADESVTSSTTLQNDDELKIPIQANEKVVVRFVLLVDVQGAVGIKVAVTVPSGATMDAGVVAVGTGNVPVVGVGSTSGSAIIATTPGYALTVIYVDVTVSNGATAGDVQLQWAQNTSSGTASKVLRGSSAEAKTIPS